MDTRGRRMNVGLAVEDNEKCEDEKKEDKVEVIS